MGSANRANESEHGITSRSGQIEVHVFCAGLIASRFALRTAEFQLGDCRQCATDATKAVARERALLSCNVSTYVCSGAHIHTSRHAVIKIRNATTPVPNPNSCISFRRCLAMACVMYVCGCGWVGGCVVDVWAWVFCVPRRGEALSFCCKPVHAFCVVSDFPP